MSPSEQKRFARALLSGDEDAVRAFLDAGGDPDAIVLDGDRALHLAKTAGVASLLLARGADPNARGTAARAPLHYAVWEGPEIASLLVDAGADLEAADDVECTALHTAADVMEVWRARRIFALRSARVLLDRGARVDSVNRRGETPLMCAARTGFAPFAQLLLSYGADPSVREHRGVGLAQYSMHGYCEGWGKDLVRVLCWHGVTFDDLAIAREAAQDRIVFTVRWGEHGKREVAAMAELDGVLDEIHAAHAQSKLGMLAEIHAPSGTSIAIGLGGAQSVVSYVGLHGEPPHLLSAGDRSAPGTISFRFSSQTSEFPCTALVPTAQAREAAHEFIRTMSPPRCIAWRR